MDDDEAFIHRQECLNLTTIIMNFSIKERDTVNIVSLRGKIESTIEDVKDSRQVGYCGFPFRFVERLND